MLVRLCVERPVRRAVEQLSVVGEHRVAERHRVGRAIARRRDVVLEEQLVFGTDRVAQQRRRWWISAQLQVVVEPEHRCAVQRRVWIACVGLRQRVVLNVPAQLGSFGEQRTMARLPVLVELTLGPVDRVLDRPCQHFDHENRAYLCFMTYTRSQPAPGGASDSSRQRSMYITLGKSTSSPPARAASPNNSAAAANCWA